MHEFLVFTISGLTTAGIYAISAAGLTLTYVTTGVFNIAHGATGMFAAFLYWQLTSGWGLPAPLALVLVVGVLAPLFGLLLERAVMTRLGGAPESARLMATVAVLVVLVASAQWIWNPSEFRRIQEMLPGRTFTLGDVEVPYNDVIVLAIAGAVALGLWVLLRRTRAGVAMRARVDDPALATLNGARQRVSAQLAWAISSALAALAGILIAPKVTMSALPLTLLIVNAYAAAVIGRLRSLPMTFAGALAVGLAADYAIGYFPKISYGQQYIRGLVPVIPVVVLLVALLVLRASRLRGRPTAIVREITPTPTWRGGLWFAAAVLAAAVMAATTLPTGDLFASTKMWGLAIVGLSMVPLVGYAGRISLCQLSFAGIGAVVVAHAGEGGNPAALLLAAAVAAVVGAIVSLPALRLSGIYLALLTGAVAVALDSWIFNLPAFHVFGHRFDLFEAGSLTIDRFGIGDWRLDSSRSYFLFGAVLFVLCALGVIWLRRSELGQRLVAVKESPAASATLGMNVRATTLAVFTVSAGLAGLGGAVYGGAVQSSAADPFSFFNGLTLLLMVVVAGVSSIGAGLFAGLMLGSTLMDALGDDAARILQLGTGLAALGLAADPNGMISAQLRPRYEVLTRVPAVLVGGVGLIVAAWALTVADVLSGAVFAVVVVLALVAAPGVAEAVLARRTATEPVADPTAEAAAAGGGAAAADVGAADTVGDGLNNDPDRGLSGPLEWLGFDEPVSRSDLEVISARLALDTVSGLDAVTVSAGDDGDGGGGDGRRPRGRRMREAGVGAA
ncbi:MAG: ABC transporter permease [Frankia sp.]|nr:ABC transporter permease [Frankia sp.]